MPDSALRIVLDTNVVLDLIVFGDPGVRSLRQAVEAGSVTLITSAECLAELRRVVGYPEFGLDASGQEVAYAWFASRAKFGPVAGPGSASGLPRCRDADDQKFLELAWAGQADHLVTKDKALLELARRVARLGGFSVVTLEGLVVPNGL